MTASHPPTARSGNDLRILRAAVFAAVCVVLAGAGHTLASRAGVPWWSLGAGFLGVVVVAAPLAGRERSLSWDSRMSRTYRRDPGRGPTGLARRGGFRSGQH
jgi:hypothetical protein